MREAAAGVARRGFGGHLEAIRLFGVVFCRKKICQFHRCNNAVGLRGQLEAGDDPVKMVQQRQHKCYDQLYVVVVPPGSATSKHWQSQWHPAPNSVLIPIAAVQSAIALSYSPGCRCWLAQPCWPGIADRTPVGVELSKIERFHCAGRRTAGQAGSASRRSCLSTVQPVEHRLPCFREAELLGPARDVLLVDLVAAHPKHCRNIAEVLF